MQKYKQKLLTLNFHLVYVPYKITVNMNGAWKYVSSDSYNSTDGPL